MSSQSQQKSHSIPSDLLDAWASVYRGENTDEYCKALARLLASSAPECLHLAAHVDGLNCGIANWYSASVAECYELLHTRPFPRLLDDPDTCFLMVRHPHLTRFLLERGQCDDDGMWRSLYVGPDILPADVRDIPVPRSLGKFPILRARLAPALSFRERLDDVVIALERVDKAFLTLADDRLLYDWTMLPARWQYYVVRDTYLGLNSVAQSIVAKAASPPDVVDALYDVVGVAATAFRDWLHRYTNDATATVSISDLVVLADRYGVALISTPLLVDLGAYELDSNGYWISHIGSVCWSQLLEFFDRDSSLPFFASACNRANYERFAEVLLKSRKRVGSTPRNQAAFLGAAVAASGDGHWYRDLDTNKMWYSASWKSMLGYAADEISPEMNEWFKRVHPDDQARVQSSINSLVEGRATKYESEYRLKHKDDGRWVWVLARGNLLRDESGRPTAIAGCHRDITDSKATEAFSNHVIDGVLETFIFAKDEHSRFTFVNDAVCKAFGRQKSEVLGRTDADIHPYPDEVEFFARHDKQVLANARRQLQGADRRVSRVVIATEKFTDASGRVRWLATVKEPFMYPDGRIQILGVSYDITEKRQLREDLQREQDALARLMATVKDFVFFKDRGGRFVRVNQAMAEFAHKSDPAQVVGLTDLDLFPEDLARKWVEEERQIWESGRPVENRVYSFDAPSGRRVTRIVSKYPVVENGEVVEIVGISKDISAIVEVKEELKFYSEIVDHIFDTIPQCVVLKDRLGRIIRCNRSFASRHGYDHPDELRGKTDYDHWPTDVAKRFRADDDEVLESGKARINYLEEQRWKDEKKPIAVIRTSKIPLRNRDGMPVALFCIYEDITDRIVKAKQLMEGVAELMLQGG